MRVLILSDFVDIPPLNKLPQDIDYLVLAGDWIDDGYALYYSQTLKEVYPRIIEFMNIVLKPVLKQNLKKEVPKDPIEYFKRNLERKNWLIEHSIKYLYEFSKLFYIGTSDKFIELRNKYLLRLKDFLEKVGTRVKKIYYITGNHDTLFKEDVKYFSSLFNMECIDFKYVPELGILGIPYFNSTEEVKSIEVFDDVWVVAHVELHKLLPILRDIEPYVQGIILAHKPTKVQRVSIGIKEVPVISTFNKWVVLEKIGSKFAVYSGSLGFFREV